MDPHIGYDSQLSQHLPVRYINMHARAHSCRAANGQPTTSSAKLEPWKSLSIGGTGTVISQHNQEEKQAPLRR